MGGGIVPPRPLGYATVFTPDVMSIHYVSCLLQFFLSGLTFVSLVHEYWYCIILPLQENVNFSNGPANCKREVPAVVVANKINS